MFEKLHRNDLDLRKRHQPEGEADVEQETEDADRAIATTNADRQVQHLLEGGSSLTAREQHDAAATGVSGSSGRLPGIDKIEASFGQNLGNVRAHVGGQAARAAASMGADAFTYGENVGFRDRPDLHTAAHEAAHVVQQRSGLQLKDGVGRKGDVHEKQADAAADAVVQGKSAAPILESARGTRAALQRKQSNRSEAAVQLREERGLGNKDNTKLAGLMFRHAASAARATLESDKGDAKELTKGATLWGVRVQAAIASMSIGGSSANGKSLFPAVDAAYVLGAQLYEALKKEAFGSAVLANLVSISTIMSPLGWKKPSNAAAGKRRLARAAKKGGKAKLSSGDKSSLCALHLKATQQAILGGWDDVTRGKISGVALVAANHLTSAHRLLLDPNLGDPAKMKSEILKTRNIASRLVMWVEREGASDLKDLLSMAKRLDSLLEMVGESPKWAARVPKPKDKKPDADDKTKAVGDKDKDKDKDADQKPPPDAAVAMHRIDEKREFTRRVRIKDTNYVDEDLGTIELKMYAVQTGTGQVYVYRAVASNEMTGRARQYLSMGADVTSYSFNQSGTRYCDTHFDVKIGGPGKTETSGISIGLSAGIKNGAETLEAGGSATWQHSTATTSQGTAAFRRVYRITSLSKPIDETVVVSDESKPMGFAVKKIKTGMVFSEQESKDFSGFELDDDDVGDTATTFYANWILHSEAA